MAYDEIHYTTLLTLETGEAFMLQRFSFTIQTGVQQYGAIHDPQPVTSLEGKGEMNPDVFSIEDTRFEQRVILAIHTKEGEIERTVTLTQVSLRSQYPGEMTVHARLFTAHHDEPAWYVFIGESIAAKGRQPFKKDLYLRQFVYRPVIGNIS